MPEYLVRIIFYFLFPSIIVLYSVLNIVTYLLGLKVYSAIEREDEEFYKKLSNDEEDIFCLNNNDISHFSIGLKNNIRLLINLTRFNIAFIIVSFFSIVITAFTFTFFKG